MWFRAFSFPFPTINLWWFCKPGIFRITSAIHLFLFLKLTQDKKKEIRKELRERKKGGGRDLFLKKDDDASET